MMDAYFGTTPAEPVTVAETPAPPPAPAKTQKECIAELDRKIQEVPKKKTVVAPTTPAPASIIPAKSATIKNPEIERSINVLFNQDQVIEVRVIRINEDIRSGFYTNREKLCHDVAATDADTTVKGVYVVLNEINPDILKERSPEQINHIVRGKATSTKHILRRRWVVLDFDPVKATTESNSSSNAGEKAITFERAQRCEKYLTEKGFPEPIRADSGNGAHLLYRIDLPNDQKSYDVIASFLDTLNEMFGVDVSLKDAPRIIKLYGTVARKGANTPERPHRRSKLISVPDAIPIVNAELLRKGAGEPPTPPTPGQTQPAATIQLKEPFVVPVTATERHPILKRMVTSMVGKKYSFKAILAACQAENLATNKPPKTEQEIEKEVISLYDWATKKEMQKEISKEEKKATSPPAETTKTPDITSTPEIVEEARRIYESGGFLQYCTDTFQKVWLGDVHILMGVLHMAANMRVLNAQDGIHLHIMGGTQTGKSDSVKASMQFVHPADRLIKTFSMKYLFYADDELHPNSIVFSDDTTFEPETAALYRNMLTSWFTGVTRGTVVNHQKKDLHIPPRVSLILTSVESVVQETDDGQDESRFLTLEVRRTPDQMKAIRKFIQEKHPDIKPDLDVIFAVWTAITPQTVTLHKSIDREIPIREFKRFLTLVQSHALLCNRDTTTDADFLAIDQFLSYSKPMINSETPAFTRKEAVVLQCLSSKELSISEIGDATGLSILEVYRALRGTKGTIQNPSGGLMQKEPRLIHTEHRPKEQNAVQMFALKPVK
jgi:hypothetical protein